MDLSTMVSEARKILGETDSTNSHFTDVELTAWANEAYRRICVKIESVPIKTRTYDSPTLSDPTITLNSGSITVDQAKMYMRPQGIWVELRIADLKDLFSIDPNWENASGGEPTHLVRTSAFTMRLYPPPNTSNVSKTDAIKTFGLENPTALSSSSDTPDLPIMLHDIFQYYMAGKAFMRLGQVDLANNQFAMYNATLRDFQPLAQKFSDGRGWRWPGGGRRSSGSGSVYDTVD